MVLKHALVVAVTSLIAMPAAGQAGFDAISDDYADGTVAYRSITQADPDVFAVTVQPWTVSGTIQATHLGFIWGAKNEVFGFQRNYSVNIWSSFEAVLDSPTQGDLLTQANGVSGQFIPMGFNLGGGDNHRRDVDLPDVPLVAGSTVWIGVHRANPIPFDDAGVPESLADGPPAWHITNAGGVVTAVPATDLAATQHSGVLLLSLDATLLHQPWVEHAGAVAGTGGVEPRVHGVGDLVGGQPFELQLADALANSSAYLVVGTSELAAPFKGGVLVPSPDVILAGLPTGASGNLEIEALWPTGVPSGASLWFQYCVVDAGSVGGFAASAGLEAVAP